jgi:hypothetical protein
MISGLPGPTAATASPLMELLVKVGRVVERVVGEVECVSRALTATESAIDVTVERDVCNTN